MKPSAVALIPARSGSKRVPDKNIRLLKGHPILAYSIQAALDSGVFESVICATDSERYADVARYYGAEVPFLRPAEISGDDSPDIDWVVWILNALKDVGRDFPVFSILRPTSPFRQAETIRRAWSLFIQDPHADSLRAVQKCKQHPGKMWIVRENRMQPLLPFSKGSTPWHSSQYAALPEMYVQDASLEIAWSRISLQRHSIAGEAIIPFVSRGREGFDINEPEDWWVAEQFLESGDIVLPLVGLSPYKNE
ncbi:MAG: acylneuraminate cytidylyltransferase family protein [Nitrospira sp.]|nr:acylneuraminate cytidylyltransferase family protein [Nitrospira sp.]